MQTLEIKIVGWIEIYIEFLDQNMTSFSSRVITNNFPLRSQYGNTEQKICDAAAAQGMSRILRKLPEARRDQEWLFPIGNRRNMALFFNIQAKVARRRGKVSNDNTDPLSIKRHIQVNCFWENGPFIFQVRFYT